MFTRSITIKFAVFLLGLIQKSINAGNITTAILALFFAFVGCSYSSAPAGILSKDEMAKAMTEFYLKETKINALMISQDSALVLFQYFKQKYADDYDLPDSAIDKSYHYYLGRPIEMGEIYDRVIDTLALKEQKAIEK